MKDKKDPATKGRDKMKPDEGQGQKGNFGSDSDSGKESRPTKKQSSPVPIKKDTD